MALSKLDQLYRQVILDHSNFPRHKGIQSEKTAEVIELNNPTCGDVLQLQLELSNDGHITSARFDGQGCSISMASASMMCDILEGKTLPEALELAEDFSKLVQGQSVNEDRLEDAALLSGVSKFPARIKCATLAWKALEKAIQWLESEDSISINEEYAKRLNQYGSTAQGKNQENVSALNTISKSLLKQNQKETGAISNTLLAKYNLRTMPEDMKQSLNLYAASLINSVRKQMNQSSVKVTETMVTIAEQIAKEYINDGRFIADGRGHDAHAINKVVEQYGILTSTDNSKSNGSQYYENAISTDFQNQDYFTIRAELREAILLFLFNGSEYDHAQSVAGVNFGKEYKDAYFGVGLGASGHFIQIEDSYLEKEGTLPFSKAEISQKVRTDYEQKVIQRLKEHLATLK